MVDALYHQHIHYVDDKEIFSLFQKKQKKLKPPSLKHKAQFINL
jgi:hypothetical protein